MIATIRQLQAEIGKKYAVNNERFDELAAENGRLREQLERLNRVQDRYRVLIVASIDKSIEVFADPQVRLQVVCLPETRTTKDYERATEWALRSVPHEFRGMMHDAGIRPETYTLHCMDLTAWRYYDGLRREYAYIQQLESAIEELNKQPAAETP